MRILLAEQTPLLAGLLETTIGHRPGADVTATVSNADDLLFTLAEGQFDLLLMDAELPGRSVLDLMRELTTRYPRLAVLVLAFREHEQVALRAMRAGAAGVVTSSCTAAELVETLERVGRGERYISPHAAGRIAAQAVGGGEESPLERLSDREFDVFELLAQGRSVVQVAGALRISESTVNTHRSRLLNKTGFRSNAEIIRYAVRHNLVD